MCDKLEIHHPKIINPEMKILTVIAIVKEMAKWGFKWTYK